jgi:pimeloyl-ACP methyl ester carboxylesterase
MSPREHHVTARDGLLLAITEWGGGPGVPLLCLPGVTRSARDFAHLGARHGGQRRVVAVDWAGHGGSGRAAEITRYAPEPAVRDVLDVMSALHLGRCVVIGTSFGGLVSMFLSLLRPGALAAVVLNDIGPRIEDRGMAFVTDFVARDPGFASIEEAVAFLQERLPNLSHEDDAAWRDFAHATYARGEDGRFHPRWDTRIAEAIRGGGESFDFGPVFGGLAKIPTLLAWGEASDILSAETVQRMRAQKPDLRVVSLPGIGHNPTLREPPIAAALDSLIAGAA